MHVLDFSPISSRQAIDSLNVASVSFNCPPKIFAYQEHYSPSKPGAIIAGVILAVLSILIFVRLSRRKNWWGLCLPIGILLLSVGFFVRLASVNNPTGRDLFATTQVLIITSPGAFLAFNYIVYRRLIQAFAAGQSQYSLMQPQILASVFIISDVVTFIVQGVGAGLSTSPDNLQMGRNAQDGKFNSSNFPWSLVYILYFSSAFIMVRAIYRLVEFIQGPGGYLITHEVFCYCLDISPPFLATSIHAFFWPGDLIEAYRDSDCLAVRLTIMDKQSG
ncbi:hypothetical protein ACEPAI_5365 [Sanghuangporus weigelae]